MIDLANQGFPAAQQAMGEMYLTGNGVEKNDELAYHWFKRAITNGSVEAQFHIGRIYAQQKDEASQIQAMEHYHIAAQNGVARAQFHLGQMAYLGHFVEKDNSNALAWFTLAAENGYAPAQYNVALMHYKGIAVEQDLGAALDWMNKACEAQFKKSCEAVSDLTQRLAAIHDSESYLSE